MQTRVVASGDGRRRAWPEIAFWCTAAALLLTTLGTPSLHGSEDRFAEIARVMVGTGDYFHPTLNGESHFHKPLLSYWAIALASAVAGTNELAARLPSAAAGLLALAATVRLGRLLWGPAVGRLAGWVLLTSYGFLLWGRTAAADMENLATVVLAIAWFRAREDRPGFASYAVFLSICALGAQAKGLAAVVLPIVVLVPHLLSFGRWRDHVRPGALAAALVVGLAIYLVPFVWSETSRPEGALIESALAGDPRSGLYMAFQENVQRFYAPHDHRGGLHTYFVALPILLLPWSLVFVAASWGAVRGWDRLDPETRWVAWSVGLIFALFTASGSRRSYYILPILPFCALLVAAVVDRGPAKRLVDRASSWSAAALVAVGGAEIVAAGFALALPVVLGPAVPAALPGSTALLAAVAVLAWRRRERIGAPLAEWLGLPAALVVPVTLSVVLLGGYFCLQQPFFDRFRTEKPFALDLGRVAGRLPPGRVAFVWHVPALYPFYMEAAQPLPVLRTVAELREFARGGPGLVVASPRGRSRAGLEGEPLFLGHPLLRQIRHPWDPVGDRLAAWRVEAGGRDGLRVLRERE